MGASEEWTFVFCCCQFCLFEVKRKWNSFINNVGREKNWQSAVKFKDHELYSWKRIRRKIVDARFVQATGQSGSSHTSHSYICIKKPVIRRINKYHSGFVVCYRNQTFDDKKNGLSLFVPSMWMNELWKRAKWRTTFVSVGGINPYLFCKFCSFFSFQYVTRVFICV